ncbi:MAG TPA: FkbM family methyltransferase [Flavilitoribacter sp.]|nr:FkbM family methyltransferase [Flavilitoribacter sp.]
MGNAIHDLIFQNLNGQKIQVFDVGAKGGVFTLKKIRPYTGYFGFEPNPEEFERLIRSDTVQYFPFALAAENGIREFNITRHPSYSSFLQLDSQNFDKHFGLMKDAHLWKAGMEIDRTIPVEVRTIDHILKDLTIDRIDFLKLDTQGTELDILKGAGNALREKRIGVIFSEFSFIKTYKGQNSFSELDQYLSQQDYECVDCRFYPDTVKKPGFRPFSKKIYDPSRFSIGGDAVFIPRTDQWDPGETGLFRTGLILAQLGYLSVAKNLFAASGLAESEMQLLLKYFLPPVFRNWIIDLLPPLVYRRMKAMMRGFRETR